MSRTRQSGLKQITHVTQSWVSIGSEDLIQCPFENSSVSSSNCIQEIQFSINCHHKHKDLLRINILPKIWPTRKIDWIQVERSRKWKWHDERKRESQLISVLQELQVVFDLYLRICVFEEISNRVKFSGVLLDQVPKPGFKSVGESDSVLNCYNSKGFYLCDCISVFG